jgi:hypothetical protein
VPLEVRKGRQRRRSTRRWTDRTEQKCSVGKQKKKEKLLVNEEVDWQVKE